MRRWLAWWMRLIQLKSEGHYLHDTHLKELRNWLEIWTAGAYLISQRRSAAMKSKLRA